MPESENGRQLRELVERHERDLYRGNGLPGLTTRVKSAEDRLTTLENYQVQVERRREAKMNILLGTTLTAVVALVVDVVRHFMK